MLEHPPKTESVYYQTVEDVGLFKFHYTRHSLRLHSVTHPHYVYIFHLFTTTPSSLQAPHCEEVTNR